MVSSANVRKGSFLSSTKDLLVIVRNVVSLSWLSRFCCLMLWNWLCFHDKFILQPNLAEMGNCKMDWILKGSQPGQGCGHMILLGAKRKKKTNKRLWFECRITWMIKQFSFICVLHSIGTFCWTQNRKLSAGSKCLKIKAAK